MMSLCRITMIIGLCLFLLSGTEIFAQIEEPAGKISPLVLNKLEQISSTARLGYTEKQLGELHSSKYVYADEQTRIYLRIATQDGAAKSVSNVITQMGGLILNSSNSEIYCMLSYDSILSLAERKEVLFIGIGPLPRVRTGSVTSEGDGQLFADKARDLFYTNGSNITVGVISDGMEYLQNSINRGDLPSNIILVDFPYDYEGSEGTAMMEIIHDLAPGAQLAFGAVGWKNGVPATPLDMANRITHLAEAGCKVIVDDVGWPFGYSMFEDREITAAIEQFVQSSGGSYISACGNDADEMWAGKSAPGGSHQRNWVLFGGDSILTVTVSEQGTLFIQLQWADPWTYSVENFDLFLADQNGSIIRSSTTGVGAGIPPEENIEATVNPGTYRIMVEWKNWYTGLQAKDFKLLVEGGTINPSTGYHIYGHAAAQNAISVAAYSASSPNTIESFSSRGPSVILTGSGNTFERQTPKITATDDVDTRVGLDGNFGNPFIGTSAAAPHVAAIAALYYTRFPTHTTGNFFSAMTSSASAIQTGQGGVYNPVSGFGKIRAYDALIKGLTTLTSPQVTTNTTWSLVRVTGNANIAADKTVTIPSQRTTVIEGSVTFGNANAKIRIEGTLILTQTASIDPEHLLVAGEGRIVGGNFIAVTVSQHDAQGAAFGSLGRWRSTSFETYGAPYVFQSFNNAQETFRAHQDFKSGTVQKYNNWASYSDVVNHQKFTIDPEHNSYISQFHATSDNITIRAALLDAPEVTGGAIQFRDPWYIDYQDPDYGNSWRNRGMENAVYRTRSVGSTGFKPDNSTVYSGSPYPYRGVFLNENDQFDPLRPYYSVGAPSQQTFTVSGQNYAGNFVNWTGTDVTYQNPNAEQTGVVFQQAGATATARYKGHKISNNPAATGAPGQRNVVEVINGVTLEYHVVYASAGDVWHISSTNGTTWTPEKLLSRGNGAARNPAIAEIHPDLNFMGYTTGIYVVWVDETDRPGASGYDIIVRRRDIASGEWSPAEPVVHPDYPSANGYAAQHAQPAAVAFIEHPVSSLYYPMIAIAYEGANGCLRYSYKGWQYYYSANVWRTLNVPMTSSSHRRPSMTLASAPLGGWYMAMTFDNGSNVSLARSATIEGNGSVAQMTFQTPVTVPSSASYINNRNSTIGSDNSGRILVAWAAQDKYIQEWGVLLQRSFANNSWSTLRVFVTDLNWPPVMTAGIGGSYWGAGGTLMFSDGAILYHYISANGSTWTSKPMTWYGSNVEYPSIVEKTGEWDLIPFVLSRTLSSLRGVHFEKKNNLQKANAETALEETRISIEPREKVYSGIEIVDSTGDGALSVLFGDFVAPDERNREAVRFDIENPEIRENVLAVRTAPFSTAAFPEIEIDLTILSGKWKTEPTIELVLIDAGAHLPLGILHHQKAGKGSEEPDRKTFTSRITSSMGSREVYLKLHIDGIDFSGAGADYFTKTVITGDERLLKSMASDQAAVSPEMPAEYKLRQNYPNPFNPVTKIDYQLREGGMVSLKVYDIIGREVARLVDEHKEAGYYSALWDAGSLASGVYIYSLIVSGSGSERFADKKSMVLVK